MRLFGLLRNSAARRGSVRAGAREMRPATWDGEARNHLLNRRNHFASPYIVSKSEWQVIPASSVSDGDGEKGDCVCHRVHEL